MDPLPLLARTLAHSTTSILLPYTMLFRSNDKQKQITFNGSDEEPIFYNDKKQIIFIRNVPERGPYGEYHRKKRSEEHTSELQSRPHLVCRLLLEKKKGLCPSDSIHHYNIP